jgi:hypothetical protein
LLPVALHANLGCSRGGLWSDKEEAARF